MFLPSRSASSVKPDYIVCLEDGKKLKMLRRHLMTHYGMTPDDYRAKWGLPADYPMVAPNYVEKRRALAKEIGLGTKGRGGGASARKSSDVHHRSPLGSREGRCHGAALVLCAGRAYADRIMKHDCKLQERPACPVP